MQLTLTNKILFDGNALIHQKTGVGHFAERLLLSLANQETQVVVFYFNFLGRHKTLSLPNHPNIAYKELRFFPPKLMSLLNRSGVELPLELFIDTKEFSYSIFPNFVSMPSLRKLPSLVAIHDMSPYDLPDYIQRKNLVFLLKMLPKTVKRSQTILTISNFTKSRILHYFPSYIPDDIVVIPIPFEPTHENNQTIPISKRVEVIVARRKYILHVGTIEPRKNIRALVEGYLALDSKIKEEYHLVLMGGRGWMSDELINKLSNLQDNITITGYVSDSEREHLYKNASLVCLLSRYEGFGMPVLEAGYYNLPLVLSDIPVFREIAGKEALFCDPDKPADVAETIVEALSKKTWHTSRLSNVSSWQQNSQIVIDHMNKSLKRDYKNPV